MVVPTPTTQLLDLTVSPLTANGSPAEIPDQHNTSDVTFDFDKVDDWLSSSIEPVADGATSFSISFWAKSEADGGGVLMNQRPGSGLGQYWFLQFDASNRIQVAIQSSTAAIQSISSSTILVSTGWCLITVVFDVTGQTIDIFRDGVETSYFQHNNITGSPAASMTVGTFAVSSDFNDSFSTGYRGVISRIKFWNNIKLTTGEITEEFDSEFDSVVIPTTVFQSLDLSSTADWTQTGSPSFIPDQHSNNNVAIDADGSNDKLSKADSSPIYGIGDADIAVSAWIKKPTGLQDPIFINEELFTGTEAAKGSIFFRVEAGGELAFSGKRDENNSTQSISNELVDDDVFYHVVATLDANNICKLYIDGQEVTYFSFSTNFGSGWVTGFATNSASPMKVAGNDDALFDGVISRVKFWKVNLSTAQVFKEYNNECKSTTIDDTLGYWRLDEPGGTIAKDSSGNDFDGTYNGTTPTTDTFPALFSNPLARSFNGVDDDIDLLAHISNFPSGSSPRTVIVNFKDSTTDRASFTYGVNAPGEKISVSATNSEVLISVGAHRFGIQGLSLTGYHQMALVFPVGETMSDKFLIYLDGALQASSNVSGSVRVVDTQVTGEGLLASIGRGSGGDEFNDGLLDDIRLYNRALTSGQICGLALGAGVGGEDLLTSNLLTLLSSTMLGDND